MDGDGAVFAGKASADGDGCWLVFDGGVGGCGEGEMTVETVFEAPEAVFAKVVCVGVDLLNVPWGCVCKMGLEGAGYDVDGLVEFCGPCTTADGGWTGEVVLDGVEEVFGGDMSPDGSVVGCAVFYWGWAVETVMAEIGPVGYLTGRGF